MSPFLYIVYLSSLDIKFNSMSCVMNLGNEGAGLCFYKKVCCWSNEVITQSKPHEHVEKIFTTKLPNFFSSPAHNQLIRLSVMRNFSFIFFICLSWKALSSGAWGTVCQHSNGPLWPYNLMSVLAGPCNPVHLCGLLMLELKLHFLFLSGFCW